MLAVAIFILAPGESRSVLKSEKAAVMLGVLRRDPPLEHHPTRARHREQVVIPPRLRGVGGQGAVRAMVEDEVFYFRQEVHGFMRDSVPIDGEILAALFR